MKILPETLLMKLILVIALGIGLAASAVLVHEYRSERDAITSSERERILAIAGTLALQIDGDALSTMEAQHPGVDTIGDWSQAPSSIRELQRHLQEINHLHRLPTDLYTLSIAPTHRAEIEADPGALHLGATRFGVTSGDRPYWHHSYDYRPEMAPALGGELSWTGVYADEHGEWISAYAPIRSTDGQVVALLEVDTPVGILLARLWREMQGRVLVLVLALAAALLVISAMVRRLTDSLRQLSQDAVRFGEGDYHTPICAEGGREVEQLSAALEFARRAISEHLSQQERSRLELEEALYQAQASTRAKGEFLARMSHELRTPLNGILGMASLLDTTPLDPPQREYTEIIRDSGAKLLELVSDILDFSQSESGTLDCEAFDPSALIRGALSRMRPGAEARGLALGCTLEDSLPEQVIGAPERTGKILRHLLHNATRFTTAGHVHVRARCAEDGDGLCLEIEIEDTGIGIDEALQSRLFEPFTQADTSMSRPYDGAGMGLAISRRLVEQLGGSIGVRSSPEAGSTFWFRIRVRASTRGGDSAAA